MEDARTESTTRKCEMPEENTAEKRCDRCLEWYHSTCTTLHLDHGLMLGFIQCMCLVVFNRLYNDALSEFVCFRIIAEAKAGFLFSRSWGGGGGGVPILLSCVQKQCVDLY